MTEMDNRQPAPELSAEDAELLSAYIDERLTEAERTLLAERLEQDATLRTELAAMRQTVRWLNELPPLTAPRDFTLTQEMLAQPTPTPSKVIPLYRQVWLPLASAAAILVAVIGLLVLLPQLGNRDSTTLDVAVAPTVEALPQAVLPETQDAIPEIAADDSSDPAANEAMRAESQPDADFAADDQSDTVATTDDEVLVPTRLPPQPTATTPPNSPARSTMPEADALAVVPQAESAEALAPPEAAVVEEAIPEVAAGAAFMESDDTDEAMSLSDLAETDGVDTTFDAEAFGLALAQWLLQLLTGGLP